MTSAETLAMVHAIEAGGLGSIEASNSQALKLQSEIAVFRSVSGPFSAIGVGKFQTSGRSVSKPIWHSSCLSTDPGCPAIVAKLASHENDAVRFPLSEVAVS